MGQGRRGELGGAEWKGLSGQFSVKTGEGGGISDVSWFAGKDVTSLTRWSDEAVLVGCMCGRAWSPLPMKNLRCCRRRRQRWLVRSRTQEFGAQERGLAVCEP